jgi:hypothetical protein
MAVWRLASALAAGCSTVLKPTEQTRLTALRRAELVEEAGFPSASSTLLRGLATQQGSPSHSDFDKEAFTDSIEVGRKDPWRCARQSGKGLARTWRQVPDNRVPRSRREAKRRPVQFEKKFDTGIHKESNLPVTWSHSSAAAGRQSARPALRFAGGQMLKLLSAFWRSGH